MSRPLFRREAIAAAAAAGLAAWAPGARAQSDALDLARLPVGRPMAEAEAALARRGVQGGRPFGRYVIYETPVFDRVFARQRLILIGDDGRLSMVVALADPNFADEIAGVFGEVFEAALTKYGRPRYTYERGRFGGDIAGALARNAFARRFEWRLRTGELRVGIPRRIDRRLRVETQFAQGLRQTTQENWGVPVI